MKQRFWVTPLCVLVIIIMAAGAAELSERQKELFQEFLNKYPQADDNGDGTLTFTEVWLYRTRANKAKRQAEMRAASQFMQASYRPAPIEEGKSYGPPPGKKIRLFILSGQSNMAGQGLSGELPEEMLRPNERILMFEDGKWQPLRPLIPVFGPEIAFAHAIAKAWPNETIGIVKQARGGTGVLAWNPNWTKEKADLTGDGRKGNLWKELTGKVRAAQEAAPCEVAGFVWQQGAKDMGKLETGKQYLANLTALVEGLREAMGVKMPFVYGSYRTNGIPDDLSDLDPASLQGKTFGRPGGAYVLKAQWDAQQTLVPARMVPLRDLPTHRENIHANTEGQLTMGRLFAEGYLDLTSR